MSLKLTLNGSATSLVQGGDQLTTEDLNAGLQTWARTQLYRDDNAKLAWTNESIAVERTGTDQAPVWTISVTATFTAGLVPIGLEDTVGMRWSTELATACTAIEGSLVPIGDSAFAETNFGNRSSAPTIGSGGLSYIVFGMNNWAKNCQIPSTVQLADFDPLLNPKHHANTKFVVRNAMFDATSAYESSNYAMLMKPVVDEVKALGATRILVARAMFGNTVYQNLDTTNDISGMLAGLRRTFDDGTAGLRRTVDDGTAALRQAAGRVARLQQEAISEESVSQFVDDEAVWNEGFDLYVEEQNVGENAFFSENEGAFNNTVDITMPLTLVYDREQDKWLQPWEAVAAAPDAPKLTGAWFVESTVDTFGTTVTRPYFGSYQSDYGIGMQLNETDSSLTVQQFGQEVQLELVADNKWTGVDLTGQRMTVELDSDGNIITADRIAFDTGDRIRIPFPPFAPFGTKLFDVTAYNTSGTTGFAAVSLVDPEGPAGDPWSRGYLQVGGKTWRQTGPTTFTDGVETRTVQGFEGHFVRFGPEWSDVGLADHVCIIYGVTARPEFFADGEYIVTTEEGSVSMYLSQEQWTDASGTIWQLQEGTATWRRNVNVYSDMLDGYVAGSFSSDGETFTRTGTEWQDSSGRTYTKAQEFAIDNLNININGLSIELQLSEAQILSTDPVTVTANDGNAYTVTRGANWYTWTSAEGAWNVSSQTQPQLRAEVSGTAAFQGPQALDGNYTEVDGWEVLMFTEGQLMRGMSQNDEGYLTYSAGTVHFVRGSDQLYALMYDGARWQFKTFEPEPEPKFGWWFPSSGVYTLTDGEGQSQDVKIVVDAAGNVAASANVAGIDVSGSWKETDVITFNADVTFSYVDFAWQASWTGSPFGEESFLTSPTSIAFKERVFVNPFTDGDYVLTGTPPVPFSVSGDVLTWNNFGEVVELTLSADYSFSNDVGMFANFAVSDEAISLLHGTMGAPNTPVLPKTGGTSYLAHSWFTAGATSYVVANPGEVGMTPIFLSDWAITEAPDSSSTTWTSGELSFTATSSGVITDSNAPDILVGSLLQYAGVELLPLNAGYYYAALAGQPVRITSTKLIYGSVGGVGPIELTVSGPYTYSNSFYAVRLTVNMAVVSSNISGLELGDRLEQMQAFLPASWPFADGLGDYYVTANYSNGEVTQAWTRPFGYVQRNGRHQVLYLESDIPVYNVTGLMQWAPNEGESGPSLQILPTGMLVTTGSISALPDTLPESSFLGASMEGTWTRSGPFSVARQQHRLDGFYTTSGSNNIAALAGQVNLVGDNNATYMWAKPYDGTSYYWVPKDQGTFTLDGMLTDGSYPSRQQDAAMLVGPMSLVTDLPSEPEPWSWSGTYTISVADGDVRIDGTDVSVTKVTAAGEGASWFVGEGLYVMTGTVEGATRTTAYVRVQQQGNEITILQNQGSTTYEWIAPGVWRNQYSNEDTITIAPSGAITMSTTNYVQDVEQIAAW